MVLGQFGRISKIWILVGFGLWILGFFPTPFLWVHSITFAGVWLNSNHIIWSSMQIHPYWKRIYELFTMTISRGADFQICPKCRVRWISCASTRITLPVAFLGGILDELLLMGRQDLNKKVSRMVLGRFRRISKIWILVGFGLWIFRFFATPFLWVHSITFADLWLNSNHIIWSIRYGNHIGNQCTNFSQWPFPGGEADI